MLCFQVYKGYVDDPRNTDNSWMETVAVNFHDDTGEVFSEFKLQVSCFTLLNETEEPHLDAGKLNFLALSSTGRR